jgi:uncharacterized protein (DUF433 family)
VTYTDFIALKLPETESVPGRCGGRPTFRNSRLPVSVIVELVEMGENDSDLLGGYPRLTPELLEQVRRTLAEFPRDKFR